MKRSRHIVYFVCLHRNVKKKKKQLRNDASAQKQQFNFSAKKIKANSKIFFIFLSVLSSKKILSI